MTTNCLKALMMLAAIAGRAGGASPRTLIDENLKVVQINSTIRREFGIVVRAGRTLSNVTAAMIRVTREVR